MRPLHHHAAEWLARLAFNRGLARLIADDVPAAQRWFAASLGFAPYSPVSWLNLGECLHREGDERAALGCYRRVMRLAPLEPHARANAGMALIALGQEREGWALFESRFNLPNFHARNALPGGDAGKMWDGSDMAGKTLLVFNEQGCGDFIQMLRYARDLADRGWRVVYRVQSSLMRLVRANCGPNQTVISDTQRLPEYDACVPVMSLPHWLGPSRVRGPYLRLPPDDDQRLGRRARWQALRVGFVWAGNPNHGNDKKRSMPFDAMRPLLDVPGIDPIALQQGGRAHDWPAEDMGGAGPFFGDFYETARYVSGLDLVITVDTSVGHIAGALGIETWLLLPFVPDFRWGLEGDRTPLYPTMRLFRQPARFDWESVIAAAREELARRGSEHSRGSAA